ncbi:acyltransferase family protein [Leptolyngbya sp. FACHB-8]|uniref:acyltransferase family protein n=1 Tax=unclassified Leptolyngbya TaxID=2650499 RepID=UPI001683CB90|nr:acyltransferase family protein [Leptolyngbya sp. FACHB-8]MBD1909230.1 acyltransferase family protein [Leptolyngbya sp. FACHB-8]
MPQSLAPLSLYQTSIPKEPEPKRLAWLEGIRIISAVMILLYHAQLYFGNYAFTPQPTGLLHNLENLLEMGDRTGIPLPMRMVAIPFWFGFQFLDIFILMSGFSLVLSLKRQPLATGQFLKRRLLRLLFPFWTVAWLSYPVLWIIGTLTNSYKPDAWHSFTGLTFPLTMDYRGTLLLSTSGPWWFIPLVISFTLVFPLLWHLLQRWGVRNLLLLSLLLTIVYRILAIYVFDGHPTYVVIDTPAHEAPFQLFLSKLCTFVAGMAIAVAYQKGRGPIFWSQRRALIMGSLLYIAGFTCQFYRVGWVIVDLLLPLGLALLSMVLTRHISSIAWLQPGLIRLGACSYSYFLIHNFVVDRTLNLIVQGDLVRYLVLLPVMIGLTLILAVGVDAICPAFQQLILTIWHSIDSTLCRPSQKMTR